MQKACIAWFLDQYQTRVSQSTISESLSTRFAYLDGAPQAHDQEARRRRRDATWLQLEAVLFDWQKLIEQRGGVTTGEVLQEKAKQIWARLPQYEGEPVPEFSLGWVTRFRQRHKILNQVRHGEAGSVPAIAEEEMRVIQTVAGEYLEEDIYNMDETGLY